MSNKVEPLFESNGVWVRRDASGRIQSASLVATTEHTERISGDADEVLAFTRVLASKQSALNESDLALIRVIEDLIDVLIHKDVLRFTDLPDRVQAKLLERRKLRGSMRSLDLLGDGQDTI